MISPAYIYPARILRVVDADTFDVEVDVGFRLYVRQPLRLAHVDAPERFTEQGRAAAAYVAALLAPLPSPVMVRTIKPVDSFGRYLAEVWVGNVSLAAQLLAAGQAQPYLR